MMNPTEFCTTLARQAGEIMVKYFFIDHQRERKDNDSPVTIADTEINQLVLDQVRRHFPDYGFIGEEGGTYGEVNEYVWVCDPLDGTIPYTYGLPAVAFSLALVQDGQPILGVIYNPFSKRMYTAEKDRGAFLNGQPIHVSQEATLERKLVGICAWNKAQFDFSDLQKRLYDQGADFQTGSTAILGALVAQGEAVANVFPHVKPWDVAAQTIIIKEAGGKVTDIYGNGQRYDQDTKGLIATNGKVHELILNLLHND